MHAEPHQDTPLPAQATDALGDFAKRMIQEALASALPSYWRARAAQLDAARPRRCDYPGKATTTELEARDTQLAGLAALCRDHAALLESTQDSLREHFAQVVHDVWADMQAETLSRTHELERMPPPAQGQAE